jgi:hypothetical protein
MATVSESHLVPKLKSLNLVRLLGDFKIYFPGEA